VFFRQLNYAISVFFAKSKAAAEENAQIHYLLPLGNDDSNVPFETGSVNTMEVDTVFPSVPALRHSAPLRHKTGIGFGSLSTLR